MLNTQADLKTLYPYKTFRARREEVAVCSCSCETLFARYKISEARGSALNKMAESVDLIPLINVSIQPELTIIDRSSYRIRLRNVTDEERRAWISDPTVTFLLHASNISRVVTTIDICSDFAESIFKNDDANEDLYALLALLNVRMEYAPWTPFVVEMPAATPTGFAVHAIGEQSPPTELQYGGSINLSNRETVDLYWNRVTGPSAENRAFRRALSRFVRARAAPFAEDAIVHVIIGVEALFGDPNNISRGKTANVTKRAAVYVVDPINEPASEHLLGLRQDIENIYKPRHLILHGGDVATFNLGPIARSAIFQLQRILQIMLGEGVERLRDLEALSHAYDDELLKARRREKYQTRESANPRSASS